MSENDRTHLPSDSPQALPMMQAALLLLNWLVENATHANRSPACETDTQEHYPLESHD